MYITIKVILKTLLLNINIFRINAILKNYLLILDHNISSPWCATYGIELNGEVSKTAIPIWFIA